MAYHFTKDIVVNVGTALEVQNLYYQLKEALKARGWVVVSSGDGTSYNASGDLLTSAASFAGSRAWFQIRNPNSTLWLTIQMETTSAKRAIRMKAARAAFSAGSPNATTTPTTATATDEGIVIGGGTDASPTFTAVIQSSGFTTNRYQIAVDDAAPYSFYCLSWPSGGGVPQSWIFCDGMASGTYPAGDTCPYVVGANSTPNIAWSNAILFSLNASHSPLGLFNNGGTPTWARCVLAGYEEGSTTVVEGLGANYGGADTTLPGVWVRRAANGGGTGCKGVSSLFRVNGTTRASGDTLSETTTRDRVVFAPLNCPWDASVPTV